MNPLNGLKKALTSNYPILCILIGAALVSLTIGPFQNPDTTWEFKAASGVIQWGMPFVEVQGSLINQPPLGFYTQGLFLGLFGQNIVTGVVLVMLFGLGSTFLIYKLGRAIYSKQTGLVAAALFALTPWELVLSRTFLIDAQCLFFSLFSLYAGILAIRSNSNKLFLVSGILFAAALLTKFYALFVLVPLFLFYLIQRPKVRQIPIQLALFIAPTLLFFLIWGIVDYYLMPYWLPKGLGYLFSHSDFNDLNVAGVVPNISFI